ncbi:MAG TPA: glutaminyl-peptide cyclotransferase [Pyrinomonadaceae bacterium]|nr:glutaminyl-peptide cyclotransferase [Pyrinomonadaceae bacterium]
MRILLLACAFSVVSFSCQSGATQKGAAVNADARTGNAAASASPREAEPPVYGYEVVNTWPHDSKSFTQGLVFHDGAFLESAGQYGKSSLRRVELKTGKVLQETPVPPQFFAEGMTLFRGKIYQLTWEHHRGFIYDPVSFQKLGEFPYDGDGWGLTHDGESLILSDGTSQLRFIDPETFKVRRTINVVYRGQPVRQLNELEYVKGEIYANIWHEERIARIDPQTGKVLGWIDLTGIISRSELSDDEAVLNGIAYDEATGRLFVTGKLWPKIFEIRLKK